MALEQPAHRSRHPAADLERHRANVLAGPQQIIFINRGRADGVSPGDVFEAFKPASGVPGTSSEQMQVVLEIVHTRDHSSSGLILNIGHPNLVPGMPVRLIRKMPS